MIYKTIFSSITSPHKSAVSVIRISGEKTQDCLKSLGINNILIPNYSFYKKLKINNQIIDESVITYYKSPKSFTGDDVAEICIHNSPYVLKKIYQELLKINDVEIANNGEFSKRAFLNGKIDLIQAEAIPDLINSETEAQHLQSIKQLTGELGKIYDKWREEIIDILSFIEALIDFPEDDIDDNIKIKISKKIQDLKTKILTHLDDNELGLKIKNGLKLAIIGAPNTGKSSLINFLAKSEISIVSEISGTTRDVINHKLDIMGIAVIISDTAGITQSNDPIEIEGIKRALNKAKEADIKIYMIDCLNPIISNELIDKKTILVFNKIDEFDNFNPDNIIKINNFSNNLFIKTSIKNNINTNLILDSIKKIINSNYTTTENALITQERYRNILNNSIKFLDKFNLEKNIEINAEYLRLCANEISKISGKIDIDNILDSIFSKFCIGK